MGYIIGLNPTEVYTSAENAASGKGFGASDIAETHDGKRYRYVLSTDTIAQYDVVAITSAGVASRLTKTLADGGPLIGVAQASLTSGSFGWVQTVGATTVNCLSTCSSSVALYTSGTAGSLDDSATSQVKVAGITILANITAAGPANGLLSTIPFAAL